jgi:hypothetical protein
LIYTGAIVRNVETAVQISKIVDNSVAYIFVDSEKKVSELNYGPNDVGNIEKEVSKFIVASTLLTYKGNDLTVRAADTLIRVLTPNLTGAKIAIAGVGNIGMKLGLSLLERGNSIYFYSQDSTHSHEVSTLLNKLKLRTTISRAHSANSLYKAVDQAEVLIATSNRKNFIGLEHINMMKHLGTPNSRILIDVGKGCFLEEVNTGDNTIMRVDVGDELSSEIDSLVTQSQFLTSSLKVRNIGGARYIVRGVVGKKGDIVIDSLTAPTNVLGKCDGDGNLQLLSELEVSQILNKIKEEK